MNVLLLSSRFPWPAFTGDRARATIWLSALAHETNVALVCPKGTVPPTAPRFRFHPAAPSITRGLAGATRVLRGLPLHALLPAPYDWRGAIARARNDVGEFDATVVLLSRLDPWVRDLLPDGLHVLDAIDSLRVSTAERARASSPLLRWFWAEESRRIGRVEEEAARAYDRVVVVSEGEEARELRAAVISNGVVIAPLVDAPRPFDFAFWGRLAFFANADAATWLLDTIWPEIRARMPGATLLIGGADAPANILAAHGRDGVVVRSPVDDIASLAREARVALFPVRYGSGQSSKALEAAEGGCAIVATTKAMRALDSLAQHAFLADDAQALAQSAVAAISDEPRRAQMAQRLRRAVEITYARDATLAKLAALLREAAA